MYILVVLSVVFGAVQGLTEFLPISSSGHLLILHEFVELGVDELTFDASIHLGTLGALFVFFWKDIRGLIIAFFRSISKRSIPGDRNTNLWKIIAVGTIPAVLAGYFGEGFIEDHLRSAWIVVATLLVGGVLFLVAEKYGKKERDASRLTFVDSLIIGIAQALALIPGLSRSGATITAGMFLGMTRHDAARFSFVLSIPVVCGAGLKKLIEAVQLGFTSNELLAVAIGTFSSLVFGFFAIKLLLNITKKYTLTGFALYRFALALILAIVVILRS